MDPHGIGITADHGRGTVMAMATGITALAGAPHLITIATEEIGRQPVIPLITAGKPESRTRKSGHSSNRVSADNWTRSAAANSRDLNPISAPAVAAAYPGTGGNASGSRLPSFRARTGAGGCRQKRADERPAAPS